MPGRRRRTRWIGFDPSYRCFKPCGRPSRALETVTLRADELEALRLADLEGLYQEECAQRMGISRTTLSRTLAKARHKVAETLINGRRLIIADNPHKALAVSVNDGERETNLERPVSTRQPTHPEQTDTPIRNEKTMKKIVLTANDDRGLAGEMSMHFGRCTHFVLAQVGDDNQVEATEVHANPYAERHEPGQIPEYIKSLGANVVIAGGMGGKAIEWFRQLGIEVATGGARPGVGETLDAYLAGAVTGVAECDHNH